MVWIYAGPGKRASRVAVEQMGFDKLHEREPHTVRHVANSGILDTGKTMRRYHQIKALEATQE